MSYFNVRILKDKNDSFIFAELSVDNPTTLEHFNFRRINYIFDEKKYDDIKIFKRDVSAIMHYDMYNIIFKVEVDELIIPEDGTYSLYLPNSEKFKKLVIYIRDYIQNNFLEELL